jgi:hypothetical protein
MLATRSAFVPFREQRAERATTSGAMANTARRLESLMLRSELSDG